MAIPLAGATITGFGELAIGTDAGLRVHAPEESVVAGLNGLVVSCGDELSFPAKVGTEIRVRDVKAGFAAMNHERPPCA